MMSNDQEAKDKLLFEQIADSYVRKDLTPYCRIARKQRLDTSLKSIRQPVGRLLEVGCGAGFTADYLKGKYKSYLGLDYSKNLVAYAERYNSSNQARFLCVNIKDFVTSEKFDVILMIGVLHHIPDPEKILDDLRPLLAQGGCLVVNEPQRGNPLISMLRRIRKKVDAKYSSDQVEFTYDELRAMFEKHDYEVRCFPQGILSTPLAETRFLPSLLGLPIAWLARIVDPVLELILDYQPLRALAWNIVIEAKVGERSSMGHRITSNSQGK